MESITTAFDYEIIKQFDTWIKKYMPGVEMLVRPFPVQDNYEKFILKYKEIQEKLRFLNYLIRFEINNTNEWGSGIPVVLQSDWFMDSEMTMYHQDIYEYGNLTYSSFYKSNYKAKTVEFLSRLYGTLLDKAFARIDVFQNQRFIRP